MKLKMSPATIHSNWKWLSRDKSIKKSGCNSAEDLILLLRFTSVNYGCLEVELI